MIGSAATLSEPRQEIYEPTQIVVPEVCPPGSDDHGRIVGQQIRPLPREPGELPCIIVEEDAVLAPRLPAFD
jgi:hypothetical protein